ncbi:MAG: type II toxin-antitoxin system VapC family toxin [Deltaproteobacteria bacterium]|nr:type II toxin-antitoxin system VapC family toxin [Deltaproteobacteria bacterium]
MSRTAYFDTSALAKWYINEKGSEAVEKYILEQGPVAISDLTIVEMRSLLARRRREKHFDSALEMEIFSTFQEDLRKKNIVCHSLPYGLAAAAVHLLNRFPQFSLATLDALHLALVGEVGLETLATADRVMSKAAEAMGLKVIRFH